MNTIILIFCLVFVVSSQNCENLNYPRQYVSYKLRQDEKIVFDGKLDEPAWTNVGFSELFEDIEGPSQPKPYYDTRMKMRWDDDYLYVGGYLEEPQAWANLTVNNSIIFYDNDFEVFIDPDGTNHFYKELEMNARNLNWNLILCRPYLNGGPPVCNFTVPGMCSISAPQFDVPWWDISPELRSGVYIDGELNNPAVGTKYWSIEIGIPLKQYYRYERLTYPPKEGELWRINFSRVEWHVYVEKLSNGTYAYWKNSSQPEENWVWQPTYVNPPNMHVPEYWGYLQFAHGPVNSTQPKRDPTWPVRDALMKVYYSLTYYYSKYQIYTTDLNVLVNQAGLPSYVANGLCASIPYIAISSPDQFTVTISNNGYVGNILNDRYLWFN